MPPVPPVALVKRRVEWLQQATPQQANETLHSAYFVAAVVDVRHAAVAVTHLYVVQIFAAVLGAEVLVATELAPVQNSIFLYANPPVRALVEAETASEAPVARPFALAQLAQQVEPDVLFLLAEEEQDERDLEAEEQTTALRSVAQFADVARLTVFLPFSPQCPHLQRLQKTLFFLLHLQKLARRQKLKREQRQ